MNLDNKSVRLPVWMRDAGCSKVRWTEGMVVLNESADEKAQNKMFELQTCIGNEIVSHTGTSMKYVFGRRVAAIYLTVTDW